MTLEEFKETLTNGTPPDGIDDLLTALWYDANGNWDKAHQIAQDNNSFNGAWVHAYLHRREGDESNAAYWYSRAGKFFSKYTLQDEWDEITTALLK